MQKAGLWADHRLVFPSTIGTALSLALLTWDEDEAYKLIKDAWACLCEEHLKEAGKPDYELAAMNDDYARI